MKTTEQPALTIEGISARTTNTAEMQAMERSHYCGRVGYRRTLPRSSPIGPIKICWRFIPTMRAINTEPIPTWWEH